MFLYCIYLISTNFKL